MVFLITAVWLVGYVFGICTISLPETKYHTPTPDFTTRPPAPLPPNPSLHAEIISFHLNLQQDK